MALVIFKSLKKRNVVIVKQPFIFLEKHKQGAKKGKVKRKRQVQYVEYLDSIFVDEQKTIEENPRPTPIYLKKGMISADDEDNPQLIAALRASPDNIANGGREFKEVDIAQEEEFEIEKYESLDKVRRNIMEAEENTLRAAAVFFLNHTYLKKTVSTIKLKLRQAAELASMQAKDPNNLVLNLNSFFNDTNNNEKLTTTIALNEKIIEIVAGKKVVWSDSKEVIFIASQPKEAIRDFSVWLKNDKEGRQALSVIADKVKKLDN